MSWIMFLIFLAILGVIIIWVNNEFKEAKQERLNAKLDRKEMLQSIKNIEVQVTDLDKFLHPPEKRHFR